MKIHLLRQRIDINTLNNEVINACVNDWLVKTQKRPNEKKPIRIESFLHPAIYQYYRAYASFLNLGKHSLAPPEMIEINEGIYMVEANSYYLFSESTMHETILRIELNCIKIKDAILQDLDHEQIFKRRANKIQLKAAYEQVQLLLNEKSKKVHQDTDYLNGL